MQQASLITVLETILVIMLVYYAVKFLARIFLPVFFKKMVNKMEDQVRRQQGFEQDEDIKEGETVIQKKPREMKQHNNNVGEYVDYEEVDD